MQRQSENTSRARAYPVSDARRNSLGPARSMRRGKRMKTRAYPVSDAHAVQSHQACDKYAKMQTEFKDCITKYRDDDWEEQRVGGPDENAKD